MLQPRVTSQRVRRSTGLDVEHAGVSGELEASEIHSFPLLKLLSTNHGIGLICRLSRTTPTVANVPFERHHRVVLTSSSQSSGGWNVILRVSWLTETRRPADRTAARRPPLENLWIEHLNTSFFPFMHMWSSQHALLSGHGPRPLDASHAHCPPGTPETAVRVMAL